jgi:hypothetical protein
MHDVEELLTPFFNPMREPNPATSYHYHQTIKSSIWGGRWWRCILLSIYRPPILHWRRVLPVIPRVDLWALRWITLWPRNTEAGPARLAAISQRPPATFQTLLHCLWLPEPHDECCENCDTGENTWDDICCEDRVRLRSTSRSR